MTKQPPRDFPPAEHTGRLNRCRMSRKPLMNFAVDQDGNLETINDRDSYTAAAVAGGWQPAVRRTDDQLEDAMPVLVAPNGNPMCVWSQGNTLFYTLLSLWNPKPIPT